jgi:SAM-dependent methyltransferase
VRSDAERERLRETFDQTAETYHRVRPDYPEALFDDLTVLAGLAPGDRLLEVGCATGKATLPLARRGFQITCVELGADLAAVARRNLAGFDVEVIQERFEDWRPAGPFSLVYAATAWHWVDPAVRYQRAWDALRPGGHLALWAQEHVFPVRGDPFFDEIQHVYEEIGEGLPPDAVRARPGELPDGGEEIAASGLFDVARVRQYDWEQVYDTEDYIGLLNTFSGHLMMEDWQRDRLYGEIRRRLGERPDRSVRRGWGAVLHVAQRRERLLGGAGGRAWHRPLDLAEELGVGGGLVGLVQQELEGLLRLEGTQGAA